MINWESVHKLSPGEFSEDPDKYAEPELIYGLSHLRKLTRKAMYPSPVSGALARFSGSSTSQHFVGPKNKPVRKSKASDIFCADVPMVTYSSILMAGMFTGIGIYLETNGPDGLPWIMFHVDIRTHISTLPLIWIVERVYDPIKKKRIDKYRYPQTSPDYWKLLNDKRFYSHKKFGIGTP